MVVDAGTPPREGFLPGVNVDLKRNRARRTT